MSGKFANLDEGDQVEFSNQPFKISYTGGTSHEDVVLTELVDSSTTVMSSSDQITYGTPVTLTATVNSANPNFQTPPPGGTVQFLNGTTVVGTGTLIGDTATLQNVILPAPSASITAKYLGDSSYAMSVSNPTGVIINRAGSNTVGSAVPSAIVSGQTTTLSATVSPTNPGGVTPTGNVQFFSGTPSTGRFLGTAALSGGTASLNNSTLTTADTTITASYQGDSNYLPSDSLSFAVSVSKANASATLTAAPTNPGLGTPVLLTATIAAGSPGSGTPTGMVQFMNGASPLGDPQPLTGGVAMLTTSALPQGSNSITALYEGDANFLAVTSSPSTVTVLSRVDLHRHVVAQFGGLRPDREPHGDRHRHRGRQHDADRLGAVLLRHDLARHADPE